MTKTERKVYPMKMRPVPREIIWGGNKLKKYYNKTAPFEKIAESWELTCRPDSVSVIDNGEYRGMTLSDYLGDSSRDFPLLIKLIDAGDRLSVQVHPDNSVKDADGRSLGKTEMWYIIEAEPGAQLVYGLKNGVTLSDFSKAVEDGKTEGILKYVNVSAGDVFFIPAGQIHAIGQGILLLEIQQNSDTTYRIYDYGRRDKDGKTRQLHISKALSVIRLSDSAEIDSKRFSKGRKDDCIASCDEFTVYRYVISSPKEVYFDSFGAVMCVKGVGKILHDGISYDISAGDTYYIPDGLGAFEISGELEIITAEK